MQLWPSLCWIRDISPLDSRAHDLHNVDYVHVQLTCWKLHTEWRGATRWDSLCWVMNRRCARPDVGGSNGQSKTKRVCRKMNENLSYFFIFSPLNENRRPGRTASDKTCEFWWWRIVWEELPGDVSVFSCPMVCSETLFRACLLLLPAKVLPLLCTGHWQWLRRLASSIILNGKGSSVSIGVRLQYFLEMILFFQIFYFIIFILTWQCPTLIQSSCAIWAAVRVSEVSKLPWLLLCMRLLTRKKQ